MMLRRERILAKNNVLLPGRSLKRMGIDWMLRSTTY